MFRKLLLFDIDGTLLLDDRYAGGHAMERAAEQVYGVELPPRAVALSDPYGKTDRRIIRDVLRAAGVGDARIDAGMDEWMRAASAAFVEEAARTAAGWRVREGVGEALGALAHAGHLVAVLSGNLEPIARAKIRHMELADVVDSGQGAFGSEREVRAELVPLARARAGEPGEPWPREQTVIIGDTPGDVAAAKADDVHPVVFSSDRFTTQELLGGTIIAEPHELPELVRSL